MSEGAIDNDFEDSELTPREQLEADLADLGAPLHSELDAGDVVIDLVTRQPLLVRQQAGADLVEYYVAEGFDLSTYKQHPWLPVRLDDPVFECVFIGGIDDLHSEGSTYDYPAGRLARVPVELAGGDDE